MNTTESNALVAHINAENAKTAAWVAQADTEAGEWRCAAEYSTDPAYWAQFGVFTPYDFDRSRALSKYSDYHKDCYGFRPRNCGNMTLEQLEEAIEGLSRYAESMQDIWAEEAKRDAEWMAEQEAKWAEEERIRTAEASGDYSAVNAEYRDEYTTEQAPLGSLALLFG